MLNYIVMNIANLLTIFRVFVSPIFLFVYIEHDWLGISYHMLPYFLLILLIVSELSDAFDGFFARRYNQVTDLGKVLDPMADSIARISVFLAFTLDPIKVPMLLVFVILCRESAISTLRTVCALNGFALAAHKSGKIKAILQAIAAFSIVLLMIPHSWGYITTATLHTVSSWLVGVAAFYTFLTGVYYIYSHRDHISRLLTLPTAKN
jgi:CDP-diacylglycerol--glycerol-3-phosphate 3-phosphatidyltransferase